MPGEWYHILYNNIYGVAACALRLTNTYGPRMRVKDARQTFLGYWIRSLVEGLPFEVWGGRQLRDFTFVDDAVDALILAAVEEATNGKVFNLGGDCPVSLNDLAALAAVFFAVAQHPQEAVMWIAAMACGLGALCVLLTLILWFRGHFVASTLCFMIGLFSMESTLVTLVLLPLLEFSIHRKLTFRTR